MLSRKESNLLQKNQNLLCDLHTAGQYIIARSKITPNIVVGTSFAILGAPSEDRTRTTITGQGILSPSRLPIPPSELRLYIQNVNVLFCYVGVKGFEPSTSWTQTKHSNRTELHPVKYPQHSNKYGSERRPIFALSVVALVLIIQTSSFLHQVLVDICEPSEARTPDPSLKVMCSTY